MKVLVTGGKGQLGQAIDLVKNEYPHLKVVFVDSNEVDITDFDKLKEAFASIKPSFCINAAAYTAVDLAEQEEFLSSSINAWGAYNLARCCLLFNCTLIHISTDFVFDGLKIEPYKEDDDPNPINQYGRSKLQGELLIRENLINYFIIRTSWLFSHFGNNFYKTMLRLGRQNSELNVVNDQFGKPTCAIDLARVVLLIIQSGSKAYGVYHFSNDGIASWFDFAQKIFHISNIDTKINAVPTSFFVQTASRPVYSALNTNKIKKEFGVNIRNYEVALRELSTSK